MNWKSFKNKDHFMDVLNIVEAKCCADGDEDGVLKGKSTKIKVRLVAKEPAEFETINKSPLSEYTIDDVPIMYWDDEENTGEYNPAILDEVSIGVAVRAAQGRSRQINDLNAAKANPAVAKNPDFNSAVNSALDKAKSRLGINLDRIKRKSVTQPPESIDVGQAAKEERAKSIVARPAMTDPQHKLRKKAISSLEASAEKVTLESVSMEGDVDSLNVIQSVLSEGVLKTTGDGVANLGSEKIRVLLGVLSDRAKDGDKDALNKMNEILSHVGHSVSPTFGSVSPFEVTKK